MPRIIQTHCSHGHLKSSDNVYAGGSCKTCTILRSRKWYRENSMRASNSNKKWKQENPERAKRGPRKWYLENPEQVLLVGARSRAKDRGLEFNLELSDIIIPEFCPVFSALRLERGLAEGGVYPWIPVLP